MKSFIRIASLLIIIVSIFLIFYEREDHYQKPSPNKKAIIAQIKKAAENGSSDDQRKLGCMYLKGIPYINKNGYTVLGRDLLAKNEHEAFYWISLAAYNGDISAQFILGGMYYFGMGVDQDIKAGNALMELAKQKNPKVQGCGNIFDNKM